MKYKYKKTILIFTISLLFISLFTTTANAQLVGCSIDGSGGLPKCTFCHLVGTGQRVIKFMLLQAAPFLAVMMILYGGIKMMVSGGNPEEFGKAKKVLVAAFVGVLIVLSAWLVINTIMVGLAGGDFADNWWQIRC